MKSGGYTLFLLGLVVVFAFISMPGCIGTQMRGASERPVDMGMDVIVQAGIEYRRMDSLGVFLFNAPPESSGMTEAITAAYSMSLAQKRPFREVRQLSQCVKSDAEALWYARNEGCDLVLVPSVLSVTDGSGALPTRLEVRTRILDARTGSIVLDLRQSAGSIPGPDIDLFWNTIPGQPGQRVPELAERLAQDFADFLVQPTASYRVKHGTLPRVLINQY